MLEKHGLSGTSEYKAWLNMKGRCYNPFDVQFDNYGNRGIVVCDRWKNSFIAFLTDVGSKPASNFTLERIDNNGNYEPGNVRWATQIEQSYNRRHKSSEGRGIRLTGSGKYEVQISIDNETVYLGRFDTLEEAKSIRAHAEEMCNGTKITSCK